MKWNLDNVSVYKMTIDSFYLKKKKIINNSNHHPLWQVWQVIFQNEKNDMETQDWNWIEYWNSSDLHIIDSINLMKT